MGDCCHYISRTVYFFRFITWCTVYICPVQDCEVFMTDKANLKYLWDTDKYINIMLYPFKQDENSEGVILGISHLPYTIKPDYLEGLNQLNGIPSHSSLKYPHCISINCPNDFDNIYCRLL